MPRFTRPHRTIADVREQARRSRRRRVQTPRNPWRDYATNLQRALEIVGSRSVSRAMRLSGIKSALEYLESSLLASLCLTNEEEKTFNKYMDPTNKFYLNSDRALNCCLGHGFNIDLEDDDEMFFLTPAEQTIATTIGKLREIIHGYFIGDTDTRKEDWEDCEDNCEKIMRDVFNYEEAKDEEGNGFNCVQKDIPEKPFWLN